MDKILCIDAGTTSVRAIVYDLDCRVLGVHQEEFTQYFPELGWVEHDPEEIFTAVVECCKKALLAAGAQSNELLGLGITNQRETTVLWDPKTGKSFGNAITWQDRRTADFCAALKKQNLEKLVHAKTGLLLDPYFSATKIHWILQHFDLYHRAEKGEVLFGTIDSYLLWRLTEGTVHATDITNASRTLLFNIKTQSWDEELLELFKVPKAMLPSVKENCTIFGKTSVTLFGTEVPVLAMMGDQQAAMIGQTCFDKGDAKCTFGTGSFLMVNTGEQIPTSANQLITTIAFKIHAKTHYAMEGSIFIAGAVVKWLRDQLHLIKTSHEADEVAATLKDNGGVYFVPAFTGLGAPYWDPNARGAIFGLTRDTSAAHIIRAGLEAIAYQAKDLVLTFENTSNLARLQVDGGVTANRWLMQFLADLLQMEILISDHPESTALGVAYLVLLTAGVKKNLAEFCSGSNVAITLKPKKSKDEMWGFYQGWLEAVGRVI